MTDTKTKPTAEFFSLKSPLLVQGRLDNRLARTELMTLRVVVFAAGGETEFHKHLYEDHAFIVLQGQATFRTETEDNVKVINKGEGVMLPKGVYYSFQSSGSENLIMIRTGAALQWLEPHKVMTGDTPFVHHKRLEQIVLPGQFFAG